MLNRAWRPGLRPRARRVFHRGGWLAVIELIVFAALAFAAVVVFSVLTSVMWLIFLPFRIFGLLFKAVAFLLALPFLALFGAFGFLVFGAGMLVLFLPVVPFLLIAMGAWLLVRRRPASTASVTT